MIESWPVFIERLKDKDDGRMQALAPLAELLAADPDMSLLYPFTSLWFFGLSRKPWETEPHGFDVVIVPRALGELDGEISLLVGDIGFKDAAAGKTFSIAKGSPQYIFTIMKAMYKKQ